MMLSASLIDFCAGSLGTSSEQGELPGAALIDYDAASLIDFCAGSLWANSEQGELPGVAVIDWLWCLQPHWLISVQAAFFSQPWARRTKGRAL
jgi:hypothetical protein